MASDGPPIEETPAAAVMAGALPAVFWALYSLSNVIVPGADAIPGGLTITKIIYLAMIPATVIAAIRWRAYGWPGRTAYALFLAWALVTCLWRQDALAVDVPKQFVIYGLLGLSAAQMLVGAAFARRAFAASLCLVAVGLSAWTIGYALTSGFAYRLGVPTNPNLPASLIGPGLLMAAALYGRPAGKRGRRIVLAVALLAAYACLLLGSRGVLLALVAGVVVLWWRMRPSLRHVRGFIVGGVAVIALAQFPVVPYTLWNNSRALVSRLRSGTPAEVSRSGTAGPGADSAARGAAPGGLANAPAAGGAGGVATGPPVTVLDPTASRSTAIARFGEEETASFNLRRDLWLRALLHVGSGPIPMFAGGGVGMSQVVAHEANPVFRNIHNAVLQVWVDFGLIGLALFGWFHWQIARRLWSAEGWYPAATLAGLVFWLTVGLTATVTDMHVYWVGLAAAATGALGQGHMRSEARESQAVEP